MLFNPILSTPVGQSLTSLRQPFFVVPSGGKLQSLTVVIGQPPEGHYSLTLDLRRRHGQAEVSLCSAPLTISAGATPYLPIQIALTDRELAAGDVLLLTAHVSHGGGQQQTDVGSNLYRVDGHAGSGLLVSAIVEGSKG